MGHGRTWLRRKRPSSRLDVRKTARHWGLVLLACVVAVLVVACVMTALALALMVIP